MMTYHGSRTALCVLVLLVMCCACSAGTIGQAKRDTPDGLPVSLQGLSVTAILPGSVYVEQPDRTAGIRVETTRTLAVGDLVNVEGVIDTDSNLERYIAAEPTYPVPTGAKLSVKPVGLANRAMVGGDFGFQLGIPGDGNLNTIGLLVTIWGPVSDFDGAGSFMIGDAAGPRVKVVVPSGEKPNYDALYATVTGICSVERVGGQMTRVLKLRKASDMISYKSWAEERVKTMTLDEKVGQLFQIRISGDELTDDVRQIIDEKHVGGIVYFQYNGNLNDPVRSANFSNALQSYSIGPSGTGIPLLLSMDQEGGRVTRITGGAEFPGNMGLGATRTPEMARLAARTMGREIRAVGAQMDLAPVLDVNNNPANPVIGVRSFGEDPALASAMGQAYLDGLHDADVIATGKHFPGHGDTSVDSHSGLPVVTYDFATLDNIHGRPFREAIAHGLDCIMSAHIVVTCLDPDRPATLSPQVMDGYLRGNLGFDGVVMTDSMGMAGVAAYGYGTSAVMVIQAGADLISISPNLDEAWAAVKAAALNGDISEARLNQSVARILKLKRKYGLFQNPYVDASAAAGIVGCAEHRAAESSVARAAVTLVQNTGNILPLNLTAGQKVLLVTVQSAETTTDAGARFASYIQAKHGNVQSMTMSENPTLQQRTPIRVAAAGSYLTIVGTSRAQLPANAGQAALVKELRSANFRVIVVGLREPYELASFPTVQAYLCAYNYRNCGFEAAADVIFGDANPTGLLPVTIPGMYNFGWGMGY